MPSAADVILCVYRNMTCDPHLKRQWFRQLDCGEEDRFSPKELVRASSDVLQKPFLAEMPPQLFHKLSLFSKRAERKPTMPNTFLNWRRWNSVGRCAFKAITDFGRIFSFSSGHKPVGGQGRWSWNVLHRGYCSQLLFRAASVGWWRLKMFL